MDLIKYIKNDKEYYYTIRVDPEMFANQYKAEFIDNLYFVIHIRKHRKKVVYSCYTIHEDLSTGYSASYEEGNLEIFENDLSILLRLELGEIIKGHQLHDIYAFLDTRTLKWILSRGKESPYM